MLEAMLAVIDNYDSFTWNLVQAFGGLGKDPQVFRNDAVSVAELRARGVERLVVSPGPCTPAEAGVSVQAVRELGPRIPVLGVCLGHQAIGEAYGGRTVPAARCVHGKIGEVKHSGDPLFAGLPSPLRVARYHSLVTASDLPPALKPIAWSADPADDGEVQAMRHREHPVWGVQFHPESWFTEGGIRILENFLALSPWSRARRPNLTHVPSAPPPSSRPASAAAPALEPVAVPPPVPPAAPDPASLRVLGVIPARLGATRLPGKPLRLLCGKPMIVHVWERAKGLTDRLIVATDSDEIRQVCEDAGAEVAMTSAGHLSGTDRVAEAAARLGADCDVVVNIQGDEPLLEPEAVRASLAMVQAGFAVGTCATPVRSEAELRDPAVVKVAATEQGRALYFSRAPIPYRRAGFGPGHAWRGGRHLRHVGIYAYRRDSLMQLVRFAPSPLEAEEGLEQLRALENGLEIGVGLIPSAEPGVDTEDDLRRVERRLQALAR